MFYIKIFATRFADLLKIWKFFRIFWVSPKIWIFNTVQFFIVLWQYILVLLFAQSRFPNFSHLSAYQEFSMQMESEMNWISHRMGQWVETVWV